MNRATALTALIVVLALAGCAHAPRARTTVVQAPAPNAAPPREEPAPQVQAPAEPEAPEPAPPAPSRADRSEEITPEELATIPDPVPSRAGAPRTEPVPGAAPQTPQGSPGSGSLSTPSPADSGAPAPSQAVWRVQIHASESREDADRVGRRAAVLLGVPYALVHEGGLYKVRLGAFATDAEAGALRDRAVRAGWPGAFRIREGP
jgi:hypothetical protein